MSLEQRVQVVEKELELLKAQIQGTLLKIQEHLLTTTYPTLRAEAEAVPAARAVLEEVQKPAVPQLTKKVTVLHPTNERKQEPEVDVDKVFERIPPANNVVKVDESSWLGKNAEAEIDPEQLEEAEQEAISQTWMELDKWVSAKIHEVGMERTRDLIRLYGGKERELLLRVVDVYEQNNQPASFSNGSSMNGYSNGNGNGFAHAPSSKSKFATGNNNGTRPYNGQQELVLRLIADLLNYGDDVPAAVSNGFKH